MMHKVFGTKENVEYVSRKGAYLIPVNNNDIGVIQTSKGLFFLGGGIDNGETDEMCIARECLEETGYSALIKEKVCTAETYEKHPEIGYFHPIQTYYIGELVKKKANTNRRRPQACVDKLFRFKGENACGNAKLGVGAML